MNITPLEAKRRQKKAEEILNIPVLKNIWKDENGELTDNVIDYVEMPKELINKSRRGK
ncbi:hypothetical protein M948_20785 [Virgibacillus sp. CM-4]|uniref:hypothetical protein n=1 Tax=Virgibacillus sp. CM-4 TaxID=1354277 RepID=UPI0003887668|nr:hypothetical protein [Virgibacillus sp. CM-4]EQB34816.1 hypothetical protein M948_20785 [Virgibacillus sp. CM-4]